jgi:tripartite-type tricarboxylate transporter receptor subunit TctC
MTPAFAGEFPDREITLIVPQTPGGTTDTLSRILANAIGKELGKEIVVENRPGAGNTIGMGILAQADPDGYTLGVGSQSSLSIAPLRGLDIKFDAIKSFDPIYNFGDVPNALLVYTDLGPRTLQELVDYVNEHPNELNYGSGGVGSTSHFATAMFNAYAKISDNVVHIPYQGGGKLAGGMAAGEVHYFVGPFSSTAVWGQIQAGKIFPLAVAGDKRVASMPDTPTFTEAGMPEYDNIGWYGMVAPAGTPPEIIAKLNAAGNAAGKSAEVVAALGNMGISTVEITPEDFATKIKINLESFTKLVEDGVVVIE